MTNPEFLRDNNLNLFVLYITNALDAAVKDYEYKLDSYAIIWYCTDS